MKIGAYIMTLTFISVLGLLHIEPLSSCGPQEEAPTCSATTTCQKKQPPKGDDKCPMEKGCNPFVPCSMGVCCYLVENTFTPVLIFSIKKDKPALFDDNRLMNNLSECWHPPELLS
jgi:hypothetical protein